MVGVESDFCQVFLAFFVADFEDSGSPVALTHAKFLLDSTSFAVTLDQAVGDIAAISVGVAFLVDATAGVDFAFAVCETVGVSVFVGVVEGFCRPVAGDGNVACLADTGALVC